MLFWGFSSENTSANVIHVYTKQTVVNITKYPCSYFETIFFLFNLPEFFKDSKMLFLFTKNKTDFSFIALLWMKLVKNQLARF